MKARSFNDSVGWLMNEQLAFAMKLLQAARGIAQHLDGLATCFYRATGEHTRARKAAQQKIQGSRRVACPAQRAKLGYPLPRVDSAITGAFSPAELAGARARNAM